MIQKVKNIPIPGLRNIKTALAIALCILLYRLIGRDSALLTITPILICMQDSIEKSIKSGMNRIRGTLLGGFFGFLLLSLNNIFPAPHYIVYLLCCFFGVVLVIYVCNLIGLTQSIIVSAFVFMAIMLNAAGDVSVISHALNRTLDTIVGIVIAVLINLSFYRPNPVKFRGRKTKNPVLHFEVKRAGDYPSFHEGKDECIYIFPENSLFSEQDFDFCISTMNIGDGRSHFPSFPGYRCHLMLLSGESEVIHEGYHGVSLSVYDRDFFKGDWATRVTGPCRYLSLLVRDGFKGTSEKVLDADCFTLKNDHFTGFYALQDNVKLELVSEEYSFSESLNFGDFFLISWYANGDKEYSVSITAPNATDAAAIKIECSNYV